MNRPIYFVHGVKNFDSEFLEQFSNVLPSNYYQSDLSFLFKRERERERKFRGRANVRNAHANKGWSSTYVTLNEGLSAWTEVDAL